MDSQTESVGLKGGSGHSACGVSDDLKSEGMSGVEQGSNAGPVSDAAKKESGDNQLRVMGGFSAMMIVVANMVGTGVFTTTGLLLVDTPSPAAVLIAWFIGGLVAFFGALSYAELVSIYPKNGGEFQLLSKIYHPSVGFVAGWISMIVGFSAPIAAAAIAFGAYFQTLVPSVNPMIGGILIILLLSFVHAIRVTFGSYLQNLLTVAKIGVVLVFIIGGLYLGDFSHITGEPLVKTTDSILAPSFAVGLIYVTYAYSGWNGAAYIAGEIKNPTRALPRALGLGTALVTLIYLGLNAVFLSAAPAENLKGQIAVGAQAANYLFGEQIGGAISGVIALLLMSSISAMIMAGPRVYQSIGEEYPAFKFLSIRKGKTGPIFAIILQAIISILMLITASFDALQYLDLPYQVSKLMPPSTCHVCCELTVLPKSVSTFGEAVRVQL